MPLELTPVSQACPLSQSRGKPMPSWEFRGSSGPGSSCTQPSPESQPRARILPHTTKQSWCHIAMAVASTTIPAFQQHLENYCMISPSQTPWLRILLD